MTLGRAAASALLLLAAGSIAAGAQQPTPLADWSIEREERTLDVPPGGRIEIANALGDVRVRAGEAGRVEIWAVYQRHLKDPRRLALAVTSGASVTSIAVEAPSDASAMPPEWSKRRADMVLFVPPAASLDVRTDQGTLEIRGVSAAVTARSVAGEIRLRVDGPLDVASDRGAIRAVLTARSWSRSSRLETVTGPIELDFPPGSAARVVLETQGELASDFSMAVERLGKLSKRAVAELAGGGAEIRLTSQRGDLKIRELLEAPPGTP